MMPALLRLHTKLTSPRLALIFTALAGLLFWLLTRGLGSLPPGAPSIFDLQLAFSAERFQFVVAQWGETAMHAYVHSMWLDYLYPIAYALAISSWLAILTRRPDRPPSRPAFALFSAPLFAAMLDYVENSLHLLMLTILHTTPAALVYLASLAAAVKWTLAGVSILAILVFILRNLFRFTYGKVHPAASGIVDLLHKSADVRERLSREGVLCALWRAFAGGLFSPAVRDGSDSIRRHPHMDTSALLRRELEGSIRFFLDHSNLHPHSLGFGLTVDSTKDPRIASIAATGFTLTAWVIAAERGLLPQEQAQDITRGTLKTLRTRASHQRGFFAHFLHMDTAQRWGKCEYSTIDTALCLNGILTAAAYFQDLEIRDLAAELLERVDWRFIVFEENGQALFHMAYNPDAGGDYVRGEPGFISRWDMAAEQKMMYLQAASRLDPALARRLYAGFRRDTGYFEGQPIIINPGGNLFAYHFSEAWLDTARWRDPNGVDWFENTRLACLANRQFCMDHAAEYPTYHARSWGLSAGDSPFGYEVAGSQPCLGEPHHTGTVSIYSALSCLPFIPAETLEMIEYLHRHHPQTWGKYGFFDSYNLAVNPPWYSQALYGIDKGCSLLMLENHLTRLVWDVYTRSAPIQTALKVLGFTEKQPSIQ